jgi:hypothetical protein
VSPVKYELGFYFPEDDILHSHCRENIKSYKSKKMGHSEGNKPLGGLCVSCRIILNLILGRMGWYGQGWDDSEWGPFESSCERCNEPTESVECWRIL